MMKTARKSNPGNSTGRQSRQPPREKPLPGTGAPFFQRAPDLEKQGAGLFAGFSTALAREPGEGLSHRIEGLLNQTAGLSGNEGPGDRVSNNRAAGFHASRFGAPLLLKQVHSAEIVDATRITAQRAGHAPHPTSFQEGPRADGATSTLEHGGMLAIKTADCVPLLAVDGAQYAALHAGWRGTAAGILPALLGGWKEAGSTLKNVALALGPHIGGCCYEVGDDCLEQFSKADLTGAVTRSGGRPHLDLGSVLRAQAERLGVPGSRIVVSPHCTRCHTDAEGRHPYASHRRTSATGQTLAHTNVAVIGRLPAPGGPDSDPA